MFRPYVSKPGLHYASFLGILLQSYVLLAAGAGWVPDTEESEGWLRQNANEGGRRQGL